MRLFSRKKYRVKKGAPKVQPKKNPSKDLRKWSFIFFLIGLNITAWGAFYALDMKTFFYPESNSSGTAVVTTVSGQNSEEAEDEFKVLKIDAEDLENLVNTIAYTHAVWPGYKGDITDGGAVRKHFSENLAKVIINNGGIDTGGRVWKVHFYYVVRDDGTIQYLAIVDGGRTSENLPVEYIKHVQRTMSIGIPGIKAGTDDKGEPITVVYQLVISFETT